MISTYKSVGNAMQYLNIEPLKQNKTISQYIEQQKNRKSKQRLQEYYDKKCNSKYLLNVKDS